LAGVRRICCTSAGKQILYQFLEYPVTTRREAKLQGIWCQTPYIRTANGDGAREPTCHDTGGGETMMALRHLLDDSSNLQTRWMGSSTTPGSSLVALACRGGILAPDSPGVGDFLAVATERIAHRAKVIYCKRRTLLLTTT
jgi:hypothetical protein